MAEEMSQTQLWSVLDQLRDDLPVNDMPVTLAALIYLRWADFQEAEQEAIAAFDETDYSPMLPAALHWRAWHIFPPNELQGLFADRLSPALERLNNSRHNSRATHLHRIAPAVKDLGRLSPRALETLINWLAEQPFETPSDRRTLLNVFDALRDRAVDKSSGEFRTPATIIRLLVELAAPVPGDRVYDPCFGSAGLLTAACDHVQQKETEKFSRSGSPDLDISGVEINLEAYIIGLVRLTLAGVDEPSIELGNSLERTPSNNPQRDGFDVVLANPPWGWKADPSKENRWGLKHYPFITNEGSGLFVQHALQQLRPNGRAVIIVPEGLLFRGGTDQQFRRYLIENHIVEAIVSLPAKAFMPYSAIKASILVIRRDGNTKCIRMMDAIPSFEKNKLEHPSLDHQETAHELARWLRSTEPGEHFWDVDINTLAEFEWDFTPKRRDQSGLSGILADLRTEIEIVSLKKCCDISSGRAFQRDQLLNAPPFLEKPPEQKKLFSESKRMRQKPLFDAPVIPYVRIKDVQRGQASGGSSWLSPNAASTADPRWKLKAGDILLSKSGTIGKAGVVRNGGVGAIAATGLFVLRPYQDRLDPHFLLAYLTSKEVKAWLDDRARGATVRHLSIRFLEKLPLPLPPLQVQQRVATQLREYGGDLLGVLWKLLIEGEDDPVIEWLDRALRYLASEKTSNFKQHEMEPLLHGWVLGGSLIRLRNIVAHAATDKTSLVPWVMALAVVAKSLRDSADVPLGPAYYSLLQQSRLALSNAEGTITGHLPNAHKAGELTKAIKDRVKAAMADLVATVHVLVECDANTLPRGELASVYISIFNQGPLPLRDFAFKTHPDWGQKRVGYLAELAGKTIVISGTLPQEPGKFSLRVEWQALALDGQPVSGERELAFDIVESVHGGGEPIDLGASPYVCGDPVRPERNDVFFGREELLAQIRRQVIQSGNVVLLEGNRRSGKSSVLWHLEGTNAVPGWLGAYCSLQGAEGSKDGVGVPTAEVFREMARSVAKSLQALGGKTPLPDGTVLPPGKKLGIAKACRNGIGEAASFSDFRDYMEIVFETLSRHDLGLLLMLDEFDKLQEGIDSGVTSPQVPENIRFLVQTYPRFCAILTGSRRLKRLREEYWSALYGLGTRFGVTSLPAEYARRLVTEPVKRRLTYSREAAERAIFLTSGQPYLLQCMCNRVFDMSSQLKTRSVTLDLVNRAGNTLVEDNEHFASLWDYARSDRRRFILALCHKEADSPDFLRLGVIQERLFSHGIEVSDETLIADLEFLRELELIELVGETSGGHYVLSIPLMGTWIERQQDFAAVKSKARLETEDEHE